MIKKTVVLLLIALLVLTGCGKNNETVVSVPPTEEPVAPETPVEPEPDPVEICRFSGREIPEGSALDRPLLAIFGNTAPARPQAGLTEASYVYEIPVEGGLTRLLGVFTHNFDGPIGPVRSARPYFVVLTKEHNGILAHCGFSPRAEITLKNLKVAYINEIPNGQYFYRDNVRKAPHNLYTKIELLLKGAEKFKYLPLASKAEPIFKTGKANLGQGDPATKLAVPYSNYARADYLYEETSGLYLRSLNGNKHTDVSGAQLTVKNLLVQFVSIVPEEPGSDRLDISLVGEGSGIYVSAGKAYSLSWSKKDASSPTRYTVEGKELVLAPGNTWIHLVSTRVKNNVTFE